MLYCLASLFAKVKILSFWPKTNNVNTLPHFSSVEFLHEHRYVLEGRLAPMMREVGDTRARNRDELEGGRGLWKWVWSTKEGAVIILGKGRHCTYHIDDLYHCYGTMCIIVSWKCHDFSMPTRRTIHVHVTRICYMYSAFIVCSFVLSHPFLQVCIASWSPMCCSGLGSAPPLR